MEYPLDHVAIAVPSLDQCLPLYELLTGTIGSARERIDAQQVDVVFVGSGQGRLELIEPTAPDSPVGRFLSRRGPGLHHLAFRVPDLQAALRDLSSLGIELIDHEPRRGAHGRSVAFLHPRSTHGVLVELVQG